MVARPPRLRTTACPPRLREVPLPPPVERRVRAAAAWTARRAQYLSGRLEGLAYRLGGQAPDPDVDDAVLVQRVRSSLGPLEKQLDVPRLHATSTGHVIDLHGVVGSDHEARRLEERAAGVSGVATVRSHLHIGLGPGDTRPSTGRARTVPSPAWREFVGAARAAGLPDDEEAERAAQAVLATLWSCLPDVTRDHVMGHLPADVRWRSRAPLEVGRLRKPRTVEAFDHAVAERGQMRIGDASVAGRAVLDTLRRLVPEEVDDVEAVLPRGLTSLWASPMAVPA